MTGRALRFSPEEMDRLREVCRALGTSYVEFVRWAVVRAMDEVEGAGRAAAERRRREEREGARPTGSRANLSLDRP